MDKKVFLEKVAEIAKEKPQYQTGHDGSDGYCDCIGLIKGAIRRAGGTPKGLSGTNYAARNTIKGLKGIISDSDLKAGEVVLKSRDPGEKGYDLPDKYRKGGSEHNGDLRDYYHIGIVTGVYPLRITHMTTPTVKTDTQLGKWTWAGTLPQLEENKGGGGMDTTATVSTPNAGPVNVRAGSSTSFSLVGKVPHGEKVKITLKGDRWSRCEFTEENRTKVGWIKNEFLVFDAETAGSGPGEMIKLSISVTEDQARAALPFLESLTKDLSEKIGRG